ncbi:Pentatricopeptide repeat-containing protein [Apostasia shenzhenica]|uniref:Pentatricopeptide repeat-containing protein n=1 Tax=Apostasia shenzhenica TaxID=1088818 RepID=A0A2I0B6J0_9ASPA|nr:Pentatricopeptide repeat-containing protein [Apostasia shenzhenica]
MWKGQRFNRREADSWALHKNWFFDKCLCGYFSDLHVLKVSNARKVFEEMPSRNAISWTAMISGYIKVKKMRIAISMFDIMPVKNHISWSVMLGGFIHCRLFGEAIEFFSKMLSHGVIATSHSIVNVVTACVILGNFKHGCKIHGYVEKLGFNFDYMIEASLVSMYCACLDVKEAELEFKKFNTKFIGSWNSLLRGFINSGTKHIDEARNVFDNMENKDYISWNSMISGYLKNNKLYDAIELFRKMPKPTVETFTALMFGFMEHGDLEEAEKLFIMMPQRDVVSYTALVFGYVENGKLDKAMELFRNMPERNVVSYNIMISGLLRHGRTREAYDLFKNCPEKDDVSWDSLVIGFVHNELYFEAIQLYREMVLLDLTPSELVIASLIRASVKLLKLIHGEQMHGATIKLGYQSCLIVGNSLVNMYGKFGNVYMAKLVFDQMTDCDVVTWNALIHSYACNGLGKEAIAAFEESKTMKIKPDDITFLGVLFACNHGFLWAEAQRYFNSMKSDYGIKPRLAHYSCLIDLLCRVGMAEKAEELVHSMPFVPDSIAWTSILSGSRLHCNVRLAELAANQISAWDPLDRMPYLHLINVYKSAGRWDDVVSTRSKMNELAYNERSGCSWIE